jgi:hypothetical protein
VDHHDDHLSDPELRPVIDWLQAERPTASALELDAMKRRVLGRAGATPQRSRRTEFMRARLTIIATLVLGALLSTSGVGLAVSGQTDSKNASISAYETPTVTPIPTTQGGGGVLGEQGNGGGGSNGNGGSNGTGNGGVAGENNTLQPSRQVEAGAQGTSGTSQLPFTGFAAIPVLLGGIALLTTGLILRRRASTDPR